MSESMLAPAAPPEPIAPPPRAQIQSLIETSMKDLDLQGKLILDAHRLLRTKDSRAARRLVDDAFSAIWMGAKTGEGRRWNPHADPDLAIYLPNVMRSLRSHEQSTGYATHHTALHPKREAVASSPAAGPEDALRAGGRVQRGQRRIEAVRARLDALAVAVFERILDGRLDPTALAEERGVSVKLVKAARERVKHHIETVLDLDPNSSGKMKAGGAAPQEGGS